MTKVEHTREHRVGYSGDSKTGLSLNVSHHHVLVTDAELVLVDKPIIQNLAIRMAIPLAPTSDMSLFAVKQPILMSKQEKIEVGDSILYTLHCSNRMNDFTTINEKVMVTTYNPAVHPNIRYCIKILALPEHFSPEQLQQIVDGKLKEGKVVVECEENDVPWTTFKSIKLNSSNHVVLHQVEEPKTFSMRDMIDYGKKLLELEQSRVEEQMYTREEVRHYLNLYWHHLQYAEDKLLSKEWFEQNVK